jgi:microcompartment protein CcmK/EutM
MIMGRVVGTVVATQKDSGLVGFKLQIVQTVDPGTMEVREDSVTAVDAVGAGSGDLVLCTRGSSARLTSVTQDRPVDAAIVAIIDTVEIDGEPTYRSNP